MLIYSQMLKSTQLVLLPFGYISIISAYTFVALLE